MISYKKAKELKEAGFPQHDPSGKTCYGDCYSIEGIHVPTLEELIEACGDKFGSLNHLDSTRWMAFEKDSILARKDLNVDLPAYIGSSPEEAVANLYIAINKKP